MFRDLVWFYFIVVVFELFASGLVWTSSFQVQLISWSAALDAQKHWFCVCNSAFTELLRFKKRVLIMPRPYLKWVSLSATELRRSLNVILSFWWRNTFLVNAAHDKIVLAAEKLSLFAFLLLFRLLRWVSMVLRNLIIRVNYGLFLDTLLRIYNLCLIPFDAIHWR